MHRFFRTGLPARGGYAPPPAEPRNELEALKAQSADLSSTLGAIKERMAELEKEEKS